LGNNPLAFMMHDRSSEFDRTDAMRRQIVTYSVSALVRSKKSKILPWLRWDNSLDRGPSLIVRSASVEIVGHSGWRGHRRCYVSPGEAAIMARDRRWLMGVPNAKRAIG
jgi:hypothetical protein